MKYIMNNLTGMNALIYLSRMVLIGCLLLNTGLIFAASNENAFFNYLSQSPDEAALIAFNPSHYDPRKPVDMSSASLDDLQRDLQSLTPSFNGLVLYECIPDLTANILQSSQEQGFKAVLLGIYKPESDEEIKCVADLVAKFHKQLALAVVIGNEGLIDNRYTLKDVEQAAKKLHSLLPTDVVIPFSTSEPVSEYGMDSLVAFGDFLAPNIHPAVDQDKVEPNSAAQWVRKRGLALARVGKKPVLVKETGVPNGGLPSFTPKLQQAFWGAYLQEGRLLKADGGYWVSLAAAFEAFDMPWKAEKSGIAIEGHWGLLDNKRNPFPAFDVWRKNH